MCNGLTPAQVSSRLAELDRVQHRLEVASFIVCGAVCVAAASCYVGVVLAARAGNGPATTAWVAFAVLSSGITGALFRATRGAQKRRIGRKEPPDGPEAPSIGQPPVVSP